MASEYLLKPLRTLRKACGDTGAAYPNLITGECDKCPHGELCAIPEQIERDRRGYVAKKKAKPSRKVA
jgi:hypothetical protein